jgi:hypothetical protein
MNEKKLIKELWNLWESLALCGQLSIGPNFVKQYNELKAQVEQKLNIHNVVRGGYNETEFFKRTKKYISYPDSNTTQPNPTEPLKSEAEVKGVSDGNKIKFETECWPRCADYPFCFCGV